MNIIDIIDRIFNRGTTTMQATEPTYAELKTRLAAVERQIAAGEGDLVASLKERETLKFEVEAARVLDLKRKDAEYRRNVNEQRTAYLAEVNTELRELWRVMPRLRWCLTNLALLEARDRTSGFDGKGWESDTGLPAGAVARMSQAIAGELRGTTLADQIGPEGTESEPVIHRVGQQGVTLRPVARILQG